MIILIPLNGIGDRFKINGFKEPKGLILVENKPIIYWLLDNIIYDNIDYVYIIYNVEYENYNFESNIINRYTNVIFKFLKLTFQTSGALETVLYALNNINDDNDNSIICIDADNFYTTDIIKLWNGTNSIITFNDNNITPIFSYIDIDDNNIVINIKEKEFINNDKKIACCGAYGFSSYKELNKYAKLVIQDNYLIKNEYYISSVIKYMINDNIKFNNITIDNKYYYSLGTPEQIKKFEYIFLLDLDGTLVDTDDLYIEIWNNLLKDIDINKKYYDKNIKSKNDSNFLQSIMPEITKSKINEYSLKKDELFKNNIHKIKLFEGVIDFLDQLNNCRVAIITNCNKLTAINILDHFNINKYISLIISADDCINGKPHKEPYLNAKHYFNQNKYNKYIVFEDSHIGYLSANAANIDNIYMKINNVNDNVNDNDNVNVNVNDNENKYFYNYDEINIKSIINEIDNKNIIRDVFNTNNIIYNNDNKRGGYICDICKYKIKFDNNDNIDVILKIANINNSLTITAKKLDLYKNEIYFYKEIYMYVKNIINIPYYYDSSYINQMIILKDLNIYNGCFNINLNNNIELIYIIIKEIAKLHIKHYYTNDNDIPEYLKNVKKINEFNYYNILIKDRYDKFILECNKYFNESFIKVFNNIKDNFHIIIEELSTFPLSLCHGDLKSPNIFYRDNKIPYFLDFQYINLNKGISDIIFLLVESIEFDEYLYKNIIEYYYNCLITNNINYKYDDYIKDLKNSLSIFPFIVAIWFNTEDKNTLTDINFPIIFLKKLMKYYKYEFKL
jgi:HAD superfamily hydrolase (TIGR01509 family)